MPTEQPSSEIPSAEPFLALLRSRRSIFSFEARPVPADLLRAALDVGRFAPNHKLTEPWRFTVVGDETRRLIEPEWSGFAASRLPEDATPARRDEARRTSLEKLRSKPTIVIVSQTVDPDVVRREEDYAAVAVAIQNIQLAAWALGLGCQWSTSPATRARRPGRGGHPRDRACGGLSIRRVPRRRSRGNPEAAGRSDALAAVTGR